MVTAPPCGSVMHAPYRVGGRWNADANSASGALRRTRSRPDTSANLRAHVGAHAQAITGSFPAPCVRAHREADARPDATADAVHVLFSEPLVRPYRVCYHPREGRLRHRRLVRRTYGGGQLRCRRERTHAVDTLNLPSFHEDRNVSAPVERMPRARHVERESGCG